MSPNKHGLRMRASLGEMSPSIELHLSRRAFAAGRQLSGVVLLRLPEPAGMRSLTVSVTGAEVLSGSSLRGAARAGDSFFQRDVLLSGREQSRFASERLSQYWKEFLRRGKSRKLDAGEYSYPFAVNLPSSLPSSCDGGAGRIVYSVAARVVFPLGRVLRVSNEIPVVFAPKDSGNEPFIVTHSAMFGGKHATGADIIVELPSRSFALGEQVKGKITIANPRSVDLSKIDVTLDVCDGLRSSSRDGVNQRVVDSVAISPENPSSPHNQFDFILTIPKDAPPTVEGTSILVAWAMGVSVNTCPPLEIRVPVIVHAPVT